MDHRTNTETDTPTSRSTAAHARRLREDAHRAAVRAAHQRGHAVLDVRSHTLGGVYVSVHAPRGAVGSTTARSVDHAVYTLLLRLKPGDRWHLFVDQRYHGERAFAVDDLPDVDPYFHELEPRFGRMNRHILDVFAEDFAIAEAAALDDEALRAAVLGELRTIWRVRKELADRGEHRPIATTAAYQALSRQRAEERRAAFLEQRSRPDTGGTP